MSGQVMVSEIEAASEPDHAQAANWLGIGALGVSVFALVMAEFLPPSVLTPMSKDLSVSLGAAGQAVTATAVVGAFAALLVPVLSRRWDRKTVLLALLVTLLGSNLLTAFAANLPTLLAARVLLGVALGGFWSMVPAVAMRLVPMHVLGRAMAMIFTGVTLATVLAAPVGAYIGDLLGWRAAFWLAGGVGVLALLASLTTLPTLAPKDGVNLAGLIEVAGRGPVRWVLAGVVLVVSGHFAGFTYIRPVLEQVTRLDVAAISLALLVFGGAGFIGNAVGGLLSGRDPRLSVMAGCGVLAIALAAVTAFGASPAVTFAALALWGAGFAMLPVGFQAWMATETMDKPELGGGLLTATFQVAIATGAIFGGLLVDRFGVLATPAYCAVMAVLGVVLVVRCRAAGAPQPIAAPACCAP